ncbi:MAG: alpha/beta fold hydrolase [Luteolibacter sp.]
MRGIVNEQGEMLDVAFHGGTRMDALVILGHGVTGNKDRPLLKAVADGLAAKGWPCLRFSFSGNGESGGSFEDSTITKEMEDLAAVMKTVPQEKRIAYIGHSMGAAVGVLTAKKRMSLQTLVSLAGMVRTADFLEREFGDVTPGEGNMWGEEGCPLSSTFSNDMRGIGDVLDAAAEVVQPWLLIHGTDDDVVPVADSRDAFAAATCMKELIEIPGEGHAFSERSYPQIIEAIDSWLCKSFG